MLVPARKFNNLNNLMDPFDFFDGVMTQRPSTPNLMKTDVSELADSYVLAIDLPGMTKDNVTIELSEGYLSVSAQTAKTTEEKDEKGRILRQERFSGSCSRKYYVGEDVVEDKISARFTDGVLKITLPKKPEEPEEDKKRTIAIED